MVLEEYEKNGGIEDKFSFTEVMKVMCLNEKDL